MRTDLRHIQRYCKEQGIDGGLYEIPSIMDQQTLLVIASWGLAWDHVSVSRKNRCPNWSEMEQIASLFFKEDEVAVQFHIPTSHHINNHPYCLHWWRPHGFNIKLPPSELVGIKELGELKPVSQI